MKHYLYRLISCALLIVAATVFAYAENGIIETRNYTICPGDTVKMDTRRTVVYSDTILYDTLRVSDPMQDSIRQYVVNVYPPFEKVEYRLLQQDGSFPWQDTTITEPGAYIRVYQTVQGCDSIYRLYVTQQIDSALTFTICDDEHVTFNGRTYSNAGVYTDILSGDTVYTITIVKHPSREYVQQGVLDQIHPYYWQYMQDGEVKTDTVYEPGRYVHTTLNPETGCNDRWILLLSQDETRFHSIQTDTVCENETFNWRGHEGLNHLGVGQTTHYFDRYRTVTDQDSIYELILTVLPSYNLSERVSFLTYPQTYRSQVIDAPGAYEFRYQTTFGCDSIITAYIDLDVYTEEQTATICPGDTYIWSYDGETYTVGGKYTKTELDKDGNDSIRHILNLTVNYIPETNIKYTMCKGDQYSFGEETLTQSGVYRHTFHSQAGCDSVVVLALNVLNPDTTYTIIQRNEGETYEWYGQTISQPGMYFHYSGHNQYGCDSVSVLQFTYNQVDTVYGAFTVCQNELPYEWHGISANQTKRYTNVVDEAGVYVYYILDLTVREVTQIDTTLTICAGGSISFNGETYDKAGLYRTYISCDTLANVHIAVNPAVVYITHGTVTDDHGFTWQYIDHGTAGERTYTAPGTYEFENPNPETGCNDIYRLILTKDESCYLFEESRTICEGEAFEWRGLTNLGLITGTNTYTDVYQTRAGKDSIYTLTLTVIPVERTVRTIVFCGETSWNGKVYTHSAVVYDTISLPTGCYRIERINLDKAATYYYKESKDLPQGTVLQWHGQNITTDGTYYDYGTSINGCDSTYEITVTIIPATPQTNQYAEELSACEGDTILWRGKNIWRSGVYVDTVYMAGNNQIDSIFSLTFTAWPAPKDTIYQHFYTCSEGASIRYNGQDYYADETIVTTYQTIHGCDSIVKVYLHFNKAMSLQRTDTIVDTQLPYTWTYQLYEDQQRDTVLTTSGTYTHIVASEGGCTSKEELELVVLKTYLFELDTTICETALPFLWRDQYLQHAIGQTKQYEDALKTINNTDSIYRITLTIDPAPKRTERITICENVDTIINGKSYFDPIQYPVGMVFRDTAYKHHADNVCDSIIYYEITKTPVRTVTETRILHVGESFEWHGETIADLRTWTYSINETDPQTGCDIIYQLRVVAENNKEVTICKIDTGESVHPDKRYPYLWDQTQEEYTISGVFTDTLYDDYGYISEYHSLTLTVTEPYDTTVYIHSCEKNGAVWRDQVYFTDTVFVDRVEVDPFDPANPCDSVFHVNITIDHSYYTYIDTTLCEYQLPLIIGRINPDTIWEERNFRHEGDITSFGCDSIIEGHLTIIPKLEKNDSTFVCEDKIKEQPVILGDTVHPAFLDNDNGKWANVWRGKWKGVSYTEDTIVWDCDHRYFHHIIVRPSQKIIPEKTFYLCHDDSLQLFWPYDTTWFYHDTTYLEVRPMDSIWTDPVHGITYQNESFTCDSVTRWFIKKLPLYHKDTTAHKLLGDSIWWGGAWRYYTGTYDSIAPSPDTNSLGDTCMYIYPLHLIVDTAYYFRDTITLCTPKYKTQTYIWPETGYKQYYTVGDTDTTFRHYVDSLITYDRRDSIYDLCVNYTIIRDTLLFDTICEDTQYRFDSNRGTVERWVNLPGRYVDTLTAVNGCDSIVTLQLFVRPRVITTPQEVMITDRDLPYEWHHTWWDNGGQADSTDILRKSGFYTFTMPSIHGCDSIDSLYLTVHQTHVFRDTIDICNRINKTLQYTWSTGYVQNYTTPLADDTAFYGDTLNTRIKLDSIYVLCVNFHRTYETHLYDTICAGDSVLINTFYSETQPQRFYKETGIYHDTIPATNGCDSVITLHLQVWPGFPTRYKEEHINVRDTPYAWVHTWMEAQELKSDTDFISIPGEYGRILQNSHGCDSIDSLILRIHDNYLFYDSISICADETPYTWLGPDGTVYKTDIYETGEHIRRWQTANGYGDSTRILRIEVKPIMHSLRYDTLCYGDSILFGLTEAHQPRYLNKTGIYYDTLRSIQYGCDSIVEMRLNVFPLYLHTETRHIMRADTPYVWYHFRDGSRVASDSTILYAEGSYAYNFLSIHGCDSIDSLTLVMHDDYLYRDSITICQDEVPYTWYGTDGAAYKNDIRETGEYIYSVRKQDGYSDSTLVLKVTVRPIKHSLRYDTLCYGDSILFGLTKANQPRYLNKTGIYYDTLRSIQYGCDSIIEMRLNVFQHMDQYHTPVDITDKELPYTWYHIPAGASDPIDSTLINGNGTFEYTFHTLHGCDSVDHLTVIVHPNYYFFDSVQICSDATPYTWYGADNTVYKSDIYTTDTYVHHMRTADGFADSVYTRYVEVRPVIKTVIRDSICADANGNNFYTFAGRDLKAEGIYYDTLMAANGCDSIVELHLIINRPYYNFREEHIVEGQEVQAFGQIFRTDTVFTHSSLTPNGCDSTSVLKVVVHPLVDTVVTVCSSELPYVWTNKWSGQTSLLYAAGLYRNDTTMVDGQRMFYGLRLVVNNPTDTTIYREICEGDKYQFNNRYLDTTGEYRDTIKNVSGCDSVIILHLNVLSKYYHIEQHTIYEGDSVLFQGQYFKEAGAYPFRFTSSFGCDSVVELQLSVNRLFDDSVIVCANALPYIWNNKTIYESGIYRDTVVNSEGKETTIGLKVNVLPIARPSEPVNVTICEGDYYKFGSRILSENGTYYDTLTAVNGCDSIVMLALQVEPAKYQTITKRIFEGDSVFFNDEWCKQSGVYEYRVTNELGCTDTYQMILTVLKSFNVDTTAYICSNELPFIWRGYEYNESGEYSLPVAWTDSSRVVMTLHLTVNPTSYVEQNINICAGDTFLFKGRRYLESCIFYDTIPSNTGCDSIKKYIISMHPTYDKIFEKHISDKQPFNFHGRELSQTGTYEWTGKTIHGCDSMEHLMLTVHPSFFQSDTLDICQSDTLLYPYEWKDVNDRLIATITTSGIYNDSVLTEYGFDSVHQLVVNIHPAYLLREQYEIGDGEILKIHGRNISEPAVYYDTLRSVFGCDSIYHIVVNQKRTREFTWNKSICQGDSYEFLDGRVLTKTGQYKYVSQYKDSIVYLNLTVNPKTYSEKRVVITDKSTPYIGEDGNTYYSYIYEGKLYDELKLGNNLFSEQFINQYGCDSIARLIIVVTTRYSEWTPIPLCPGSEIKIDGNTITKAGLYTFERRSKVTGEIDSLYRVEVYDAPAYENEVKATICDGDTLFFGDKYITRGGKQDLVLKTQEGCDSIFHLDITVNPSYHFDTTVTILDYQTFTWEQNHQAYNEEGRYEKTFPTAQDCDSSYVLNLKVIPTSRYSSEYTICDGQEYAWRGKIYKEEGFYYDTVVDLAALRSAIYSLHLTVNMPTYITSAKAEPICADDPTFGIEFTYTGAKPSTYSILYDQLAKDQGFTDVIDEPFLGEDKFAYGTVPTLTEVVYLDHTAYVKPNTYTMTLVLNDGKCGDSQYKNIELKVKYPNWIIEQNWNDIVVPLKKQLNGGYEFSQTDWIINGTRQLTNNGRGYLEHTFQDGDEVVLMATRKGENYAIETCPLVIRINPNIAYDEPILVYPTRAPRNMPIISIKAPQGGQYTIYSSTGTLITQGKMGEGITSVTLPNASGMYFIRTTHDEQIQTHKVLLY